MCVRSGHTPGVRDALLFTPNNYGQSRVRNDGTGGREQVLANNEDGPFSLRMRADLQRGDDEPDRETGSITVQLPPGARAGQSYPLETTVRARHGEAYLFINGYGQPLRFSGSGEVHVAEIGDYLSLSFEFSGDADEENEHRIHGRAYRVPLTRQGEARYTLNVDGQEESHIHRTRFRNARSIMAGQAMQLDFMAGTDPQPGSYALANRPSEDGKIGIQLFDHRDLEMSGQIEFKRDGDIWSATFQFEGQGDGVIIRGDGGFDHVSAWNR